MDMSNAERRLDALERKLEQLRDHLAIYQLISAFGPAIDSGSSRRTAELWIEDGTYDAQVGSFTGRDAIAEMVDGPIVQGQIHSGTAHVIGMPHIEISGDTAVATSYARVYRRDAANDGFRVWRVTANRWDLVRTPQGWRVHLRTNRLLDGSEEARELLRAGIKA